MLFKPGFEVNSIRYPDPVFDTIHVKTQYRSIEYFGIGIAHHYKQVNERERGRGEKERRKDYKLTSGW